MKTVIIDNYDSFTYNLVHYVEEMNGEKPLVFRNDSFNLKDLNEFDVIILSPGPGLPKESGLLMDVISTYATSKIILGVCLGHQAIVLHYGGKLSNLPKVCHGVSSKIQIVHQDALHFGFDELEVGRYHSWVADQSNFPEELSITSLDNNGNVMSFKHKSLPVFGIQYHPESVLTPKGKIILQNFFSYCGRNSQSLSV